MGWFTKPKEAVAAAITKSYSIFGRSVEKPARPKSAGDQFAAIMQGLGEVAPRAKKAGTTDSASEDDSIKGRYLFGGSPISEAILGFFLNQTFFGYQVCAFLAQHWMIDKACGMPARDAIRKGFEATSDTGEDLPPEVIALLKRQDKKLLLNKNLEEYLHLGRVYGVRIAFPKIATTNPNYYQYPFNPDGIEKGQYKGIVQVDPQWVAPELDAAAAADPASLHFYEPTFWLINGKRYHRSHLIIFRNGIVPDLLKPRYVYGGIPVPQKIVERVYAAERTANEAPQLAATKRQTIFYTDAAQALANEENFLSQLVNWTKWRDNFQVKVADKTAEKVEQHDTSLADLDDVIMTSYQLVAAAANVPATKLLGTSAKGFNATGEGDESNYHEELESLQSSALAPLIERHWLCVLRSAGLKDVPELSVNFLPLDTPTAKELAETNKAKADTDAILIGAGSIDSIDSHNRLRNDKNSGYAGLVAIERPDIVPPDDDVETA